MMCELVWEPIEYGDQTFCGKACIESHNKKLAEDHAAGVDEDDDDPLPPPELVPVRRRAGEAA